MKILAMLQSNPAFVISGVTKIPGTNHLVAVKSNSSTNYARNAATLCSNPRE